MVTTEIERMITARNALQTAKDDKNAHDELRLSLTKLHDKWAKTLDNLEFPRVGEVAEESTMKDDDAVEESEEQEDSENGETLAQLVASSKRKGLERHFIRMRHLREGLRMAIDIGLAKFKTIEGVDENTTWPLKFHHQLCENLSNACSDVLSDTDVDAIVHAEQFVSYMVDICDRYVNICRFLCVT